MRTFGIALLCALLAGCGSGVSPSASAPSVGSPSVSSALPTMAISGVPAAVSPRVSAARFADGLPQSIGGQQVLREAEVLAHVQAAESDAVFLIGAWLDVYTGPRSCYINGCPSGIVASDEAGSGTSILTDGNTTYQFATGLRSGPTVLEVHVDDPRVAACPSAVVACDRLIVVDKAVWTGDSFTDPTPLGIAEVGAAIRIAEPTIPFHPIGDGDVRTEQGLTDAQGLAPSSTLPAPGQLAGVYVMPSVAALRRALPGILPGTSGAEQSNALRYTESGRAEGGYTYAVEARWLIVQNVAFSVLTSGSTVSADEAFLDRLVGALGMTP